MDAFEKNKTCESCEENIVHPGLVEKAARLLPPEEALYDLAELFKVFGDSTRIKLLYALLESEMCVCDLAQLLGLTQSAVSHQLRVLKTSKLVRNRREGKTVFYALDDDHVRRMLEMGMEHLSE
ncbi:MAG: helix-turn-helix transcriptional regulator [Oscillospiraceae bacterium]|nr:helix-turn-helix transcriptional regulator [Oscillospiraceae bacterium]